MRRTQRHFPGNLIQSRLPFKILPLYTRLPAQCVHSQAFLLIHNRGYIRFISHTSKDTFIIFTVEITANNIFVFTLHSYFQCCKITIYASQINDPKIAIFT